MADSLQKQLFRIVSEMQARRGALRDCLTINRGHSLEQSFANGQLEAYSECISLLMPLLTVPMDAPDQPFEIEVKI